MDVTQTIDLDLTDSELLELYYQAHIRDITLNELITDILSKAVGFDLAHNRFEKIVNQILEVNGESI